MVNSLKGVALKLIKSNKFVVLSSIFSIILSVSLLINLYTFIFSAEQSIKNEVAKTYGEMDVSVGFNSDSTKKIDKQMADKIQSLANIKEVSKVLVGRLKVGSERKFDVYSVGVDNDKLSKSRYHYVKDISDNEIIINKGLADGLKVAPNGSVIVNDKPFIVKEVIDNIKQSSSAMDMLLINRSTYQDMVRDGRDATYVMIKSIDKTKNLELVNALKAVDKDFRIDVVEENEFVKQSISILKIYMFILSFLVIVMCSLFIISNFQTFLYNYRSQFALIRAIGGSSKQAFTIVLIQCTILNIVGVVSAFLVSYLSSKYLIGIFNNIFVIKVSELEFSFVAAIVISICSFVIIQIFMLFPTIKSSKILPSKIIEKNEEISGESKGNKRFGLVIIGISLFLFLFGLVKAKTSDNSMLLGVISSLLLIVGVYKLFQHNIKHILNLLLPVLKFIGGSAAFISVKNLIPQIKKSSLIILSISTTVIIAVFGGTLFSTILANSQANLKNEFALDIVITDRGAGHSKLGVEFKNDLNKLRGVTSTSIMSDRTDVYYKSENGLEYMSFCYADLNAFIKEGIIPDIDLKTSIVITKGYAKAHNLKVGDSVKIKKDQNDGKKISEVDPNSGFDNIYIGAIIDNIPAQPQNLVAAVFDWSNNKYVSDLTVFYKALIASDNENDTLKDLSDLKKEYPQIKWATLKQALEESEQQYYQNYLFFIIVIVIILITLFLGLFNTLINNIMSKRKEFAILRTLKLNKSGLIKVVLTQVILYNLLGIIMGYLLGITVSVMLILMDSQSKIVLDSKLILVIGSLLVLISIIIFVPFTIRLANKKISQEISFGAK